MTIHLRYSALSDVGRVRKNNQDSAYASPRLLFLADGMGGGPAGDLASSTAAQAIRRLDTSATPADLLEALAGAVQRANDRLGEIVESDPSVEGMGTTLTAVLADGDQVGLAHVGDSRAYLLRGGELSQLTHDHTFVQSLVDQGRLTAEEARRHPHRSLILQVLDGRHDVEPDLEILTLQPGDRLLLCSDGLTDFVDDNRIRALLGGETVDIAAVELVQAALDAGSSDNVTCVVAEAVEGADQGAAAEPLLVGAVAEHQRPGDRMTDTATQPAVTGAEDDDGVGSDHDPEELRYAPLAPRRFPRLRAVIGLTVVLAVLAGAAVIAYRWTQRQYYVGSSNGNVAIYRGLDQNIPGIDLNSVRQEYELPLAQLPTFQRNQVEAGIEASGFADAQNTVESLQRVADDCAAGIRACDGVAPSDPTPTTEPAPTEPAPTTKEPTRPPDTSRGQGRRQ